MNRIYSLLFILISLVPAFSSAQDVVTPSAEGTFFTINNHSNSLQFDGYVTAYYQWRSHFVGDKKSGDYSANSIVPSDAVLSMSGWLHGRVQFHIQVNFVDLAAMAINGISGIKSSGLQTALVTYHNQIVNISAGYMYVPWDRTSLSHDLSQFYFTRATMSDGNYWARHDVGVLLERDFWHQHIVAKAGIFTGQGEQIILGTNDPSGKLEYVARLELYTAHMGAGALNKSNNSWPIASLAGGVRYAEKNQFTGPNSTTGNFNPTFAANVVPSSITDFEDVLTVDGKKLSYNIDVAVFWHDFAATFVMNRARIAPHAYNTLQGTPVLMYQDLEYADHTNHFTDGGYTVELNYYIRRARSAVSFRYDTWSNLMGRNDFLIFKNEGVSNGASPQYRTIGFGYGFYVPKINTQIKASYEHRLGIGTEFAGTVRWKQDQLKAGFSYAF